MIGYVSSVFSDNIGGQRGFILLSAYLFVVEGRVSCVLASYLWYTGAILFLFISFTYKKGVTSMLGSIMTWCLGSLAATGFITCVIMFWLKRNEEDVCNEDYVWISWLPVLAVSLGWVVIASFFGWERGAVSAIVLLLAFGMFMGIISKVDDCSIPWRVGAVLTPVVYIVAALLFLLFGFFPSNTQDGAAYRNTLVRSSLIEQNSQHTEGSGAIFLGAGSFTMSSDGDLKVFHVWQERDQKGVLRVKVAEDGEGKDKQGRERAVIQDDVPAGTDPYVERTPVLKVDPVLLADSNGALCVKDRDTGCRVNSQVEYERVVLHVPAGSVIPKVDPNIPVGK